MMPTTVAVVHNAKVAIVKQQQDEISSVSEDNFDPTTVVLELVGSTASKSPCSAVVVAT